ncbi:MAG: NAD(P)-dependent alcohol dehydrogenase [Ignavibacteriales bacterium]|nr:NAD(P)-dependent alcohol dehydrogenase [Ignavibacteriales bacterium]
MKAIIYDTYGPPEVLKNVELNKPIPGENEILIRNRAASVNYGDIIARNFKDITPQKFNMPFLFWIMARSFFGISKPKVKILGSEFSGDVEAVGKNITGFKVGDKVFGYRGQSMGTYAEYFVVPEKSVVSLKPENISYEEAAAVPGGSMVALFAVKKVNVQKGEKVLVIGASGGNGNFIVQIAKDFGAQVTGVSGTNRIDFVKALGADKVIDYTKEDFSKSGEKYDVIFDILGRTGFAKCKNSLTENGKYVLISFKVKQLLQMIWTSIFGKKKVICVLSPQKLSDLIIVSKMIEEGKIKSILDKTFPKGQAVEAHKYIEKGNKKGNVVISL